MNKLPKLNALEELFKPYIQQCRPGDWEHAKRVVGWVKELVENQKELDLLIIAAYLHDIGWYQLVPKDRKLTRELLLKLQSQASENTEKMVRKALNKIPLSEIEIQKILRLIKATEIYVSKDDDEMILVDADNLSKTSPDHIKEKYAKSDWGKMYRLFVENFPKRIKTEKGKQLFPIRLDQLKSELGIA